MGSGSHQNNHEKAREVVKEDVEEAMACAKAGEEEREERCGGEKIWMEGGGGDDILIDIDGEDLILTGDGFVSLPEFPRPSSPSTSPLPSRGSNCVKPVCPSSSSSSSSSSWSFLRAELTQPEGVPDVSKISPAHDHHQAIVDSEVLDILGDIDLLDPSGLWEPSALFSDDYMLTKKEATPQQNEETRQHLAPEEELGSRGGGDGGAGEEESACEDLAKVFLEWLRSNKDSISPEDLRSIKLKRSTIECAARRLGGGKQGMMHLLKLILAWVQNHHLQKKSPQRSREVEQELHDTDSSSPFPYQQQHLPVPVDVPANPNPSLDYSYDSESNLMECSSWAPHSLYHMDPIPGAAFPSLMMAYPADPSSAAPCHYHSRGRSSVAAAGRQPFSPSSDLHAANPVSGWLPHFSSGAHHAPSNSHQYPGQPLYQRGQRLARMAAATKEARKKRMARQRRYSPFHHHRSQQQRHQYQPQSQQQHSDSTALPAKFSSRPPKEGQSTTSHQNCSRSWAVWFSTDSSSGKINPSVDARPPPPNSSTLQQAAPQPSTMLLQQQNNERNSSLPDGRQVGSKA